MTMTSCKEMYNAIVVLSYTAWLKVLYLTDLFLDLLQQHIMHTQQTPNRQMSMVAKAPPPAAPMMTRRSSLSTTSAGTVTT